MKVSLYFEFFHFWNGILFKRAATGLKSAYLNQQGYLEKAGIDYVDGIDKTADIIQFNAPWLRTRWEMGRAKKRGQKTILFAHTTVEDSIGVFWFTRYVTKPYFWYLKGTFKKADLLICPSSYTKNLLVTRYGVDVDKIQVVSNGVDSERYQRSEAGRTKVRQVLKAGNKTVIGTVAILVPRKGLDTFISLAKQRPQYLFVWVGRPMSKKLIKKVRKLAPPNCIFLGYVDDVVDYLSAFDIFLFPSYEENQGIALLEAASTGLPLVVRDLPVYKDWLRHEQNCLVARSEEDFLNQLDRLSIDPSIRERLGQAAQKLARENDLALMGERVKKIYQELLAK